MVAPAHGCADQCARSILADHLGSGRPDEADAAACVTALLPSMSDKALEDALCAISEHVAAAHANGNGECWWWGADVEAWVRTAQDVEAELSKRYREARR